MTLASGATAAVPATPTGAGLPAEGTPFVVFGDDWARNVSTMQHIFRHIAPRYPVIWVNGIGHRVPTLTLSDAKRALQKATAMLRRSSAPRAVIGDTGIGASPRTVLQPRVLPWHHWPGVHRLNTRSLERTVRAALAEIGATTAPILVTGTPPSVGVVGRLGESASVYLCMDDFMHLPSTTPRMLRPLEERLLERVDAVVATAEELTRTKRPRSGRVHYLPQGVNYQHFAEPRPVPPELASLPRPIVGFAGAFYDRCDYELLRDIADANARGSVVLIGPVMDDPAKVARPNVHVLGPRPYRELPAYVQAFDVGIIPYVLNEETRAVDPLKTLEYLAAGVSVVCTALPEARKYAGAIAIAEDRAGFVDAVMAAAAESGDAEGRARRQEAARPHGWDRRADTLLRICADLATKAK